MVRRRPDTLPRVARLALAALSVAVIAPAMAPAPRAMAAGQEAKSTKRLKAVERELAQTKQRQQQMERTAESVATEVRKLKIRMVELARQTQIQEAAVTHLENDIGALTEKIKVGEKQLRDRRQQMATMLAALQRLAMHPPVALVARPGDPVDTVRSAILIKGTLPAIETQARALRRELAELAASRAELRQRKTELSEAVRGLDLRRDQLSVVVETKARIERRVRAESREALEHVSKLAAEAKDLKDLVARLEAAQREIAARRKVERAALARASAARAKEGKPAATSVPEETRKLTSIAPEVYKVTRTVGPTRLMPLPAQGRIVERFGDKTRFGTRNKGMSIRTRRAAQVTAPQEGDVVYAGPFRSYGEMLIIRHDDGYYTLLSGMERIDAEVGDRVLAGEPVGVMSSRTGARPTLYVELRKRGQPINPMPWLTANSSRVSG